LIDTYSAHDQTYAWAASSDGEIAFAPIPIDRTTLDSAVAALRRSLNPNARTLGDIPAFDVSAAHSLYNSLLKPVQAGWGEAETLLYVAHGPLGHLPIAVLPTAPVALPEETAPLFSRYRAVPWLGRDFAIAVVPSVRALATLRQLPSGDSNRRAFVGFADPWFDSNEVADSPVATTAALTSRGVLATRGLPVQLRSLSDTSSLDSAALAALPRLPDTYDEVKSIALALNADLTRDVFTGPKANESQVKSMDLAGYKVIAFATHGLVPGDLDGLTQPALALSAPELSDTSGDGLLTMSEIFSLRLDADWVVLSACNTAAGGGAGAEALSGLGRAFFYAGARALLASSWPVETTSAKALTTDLFRRQAENSDLTRAAALRDAMIGLIDGPGYLDTEGRAVFSYAHPIFWAPFIMIGDPGGEIPRS
jgi:CHAT domain-containing protein